MAERQQPEEAWAPERHLSQKSSESPGVHIVESRRPHEPMALAQGDQRDDMGSDTVSNSRAIIDPVWTCESMRDAHESIREVNGRQYNARNTVYSLPAGESSKFPTYSPSLSPKLSWMCNRPLHVFLLCMDFFLVDQSPITYSLFPLSR